MMEDLNHAAKYPMDDFVVIEDDDDDSPDHPAIKEDFEPQSTKILKSVPKKSVPNKPKASQKTIGDWYWQRLLQLLF